jgi:mannose-1-phosphate guanylyltransferase
MHDSTHDWALILAAGEGSRLRSLTTRNGIAVPKQFCSLDGGASLLQEALHRAESVAPRTRIATIVAQQHRRWWDGPLWTLPARNVVVQPRNRGTGIGILLPLLHLERRDPGARIALLPSDHFVRDEDTLARSLRDAMEQLATRPDGILLLGIDPDEADPELGYVLPSRNDSRGAFTVERFVEKPDVATARVLIDHGAAWNSFIIAARLSALLTLFERRFPEILTLMRGAVARDVASGGEDAVTLLYERLTEIDFSRQVLQGQEQALRLLPVPACGWSDLGTPRRVADALQRIAQTRRAARPAGAEAILNLASQHARVQLAS